MQSAMLTDEPGQWMIKSGKRFAIRETLRAALIYAHERSMSTTSLADAPSKIVLMGQNRELDARAIVQGWHDIGLT